MNRLRIDVSELPLYGWVILAIILLLQSSWLFKDAQKRNAKPWLWGIWGLMNCPTPLIVYLLVVRKGWKIIVKFIKSL